MTTPNIPNKPPAAEGNYGAISDWIHHKAMQKHNQQLPAIMLAYDRVKNRAMVQPLISMLGAGGVRLGRAPIASVPVLALGGGGFFVNFPLGHGDLGWIEASDRDISLYLQTGQESPPNTLRMHSFEDARFIPDIFDGYTFELDEGAMVISNLDGTTRIVMSQTKIKVVSPNVEVDTTTALLTASGLVTLNVGALDINTTEAGGTTGTGAFNLPANTTIGGRPFLTHEHSGVEHGTDNSGGVV